MLFVLPVDTEPGNFEAVAPTCIYELFPGQSKSVCSGDDTEVGCSRSVSHHLMTIWIITVALPFQALASSISTVFYTLTLSKSEEGGEDALKSIHM